MSAAASIPTATAEQISALTGLFDLMMRAAQLAEQMHTLTESIGVSLEGIADAVGVPFGELDAEYRRRLGLAPESSVWGADGHPAA